MPSPRETFKKVERLCSKKEIDSLFENGDIFYTSLFKVVWSKSSVNIKFPVRVAFSVSKRGFRLAVSRNLIKRRMREAYRKNKAFLYDYLPSGDKQIILIIIYKGHEIPDFLTIEKSVIEVFSKLISQMEGK